MAQQTGNYNEKQKILDRTYIPLHNTSKPVIAMGSRENVLYKKIKRNKPPFTEPASWQRQWEATRAEQTQNSQNKRKMSVLWK